MRNPRAVAPLAATMGLAVLLAGCLAGTPPVPRLSVTLRTDAEVQASPGWTVGWAVGVNESVEVNRTVTVSWDLPAGWNGRALKTDLLVEKVNGGNATFLLVDVPADQADGTYPITVRATMGADTAQAAASVKVARPVLNQVKNNSVVQMDYVGFLATNQVFDTSIWSVANASGLEKWPDFKNSSAQRTQADYHTFSFTEGRHQVIRGWEEQIAGMSLAQGKALIIDAEDAYGRFLNQTVNTTLTFNIYNHTTVAAFQPLYGELPVKDRQYTDPTWGWTVRVVSVDNATNEVLLENLPDTARTYTPYGINATVSGLSSASGTFNVTFTPILHEATGNAARDTGEVVEMNAGNFTIRWQTEHVQTLAPYALYFLVFVRSVAG